MKIFYVICFFLFASLLAAPCAEAQGFNLDGRVVVADGNTRRPVPGLTVRLVPPTAQRQPGRLTSTDQKGEFHFLGLPRGSYLLELRRGTTVLYREEIQIARHTTKEIVLSRR